MKNLELKSPLPALAKLLNKLSLYAGVLIFLLLAGVYGYMIYSINALSNPAIDESDVLAKAKALPVPRIDEAAAQKLLSLEDNSVSVQTLFKEGRTNPFGE